MKRRVGGLWYCFYAIVPFTSLSHISWQHVKTLYAPPVQKAIVEQVILSSCEKDEGNSFIERNAVFVRYPNAQATILICHGFMCDKYDVGFIRSLFPKGMFNFLTFDFRAHGEKIEGQCCTFGRDEAYDVIAAARFLRAHTETKGKPLFVYGFSMGAVASIEAQSRDNTLFDAMILDCPFDSSENVLKGSIDRLKISVLGYEFDMPGKAVLQRYVFHPYVQSFVKIMLKTFAHVDIRNIQTFMCPICPAESIKKVNVPCFFIHCKNDEKISVDAILSVFQGAQGYKRLWLTNGRRHFDSLFYNPGLYEERVNKFLTKVLSGECTRAKNISRIIQDSSKDGLL